MLRYSLIGTAFLWTSGVLHAEVDYVHDIQPLLAAKCAGCHGPVKQEAGLRLDAGVLVRQGSDSGPVAQSQDPEASLLLQRVASDAPEERMPPPGEGEPLTAAQVTLLREWIAAGLPSPENEEILAGPGDHWAFRPVLRPKLPPQDDASSSAALHPVDRLIEQAAERLGLEPLPPADPLTVLRRVTFDLTGLPPTVEAQHGFQADPSPEAYTRLVDQLLADPAFGERWGRHWMDVWRYSDWDGYKDALRGSQRHIWRWRDWIVESLNADKPYDRMIVEMLAADEIAPTDPDTLRATGFLARNYHGSNRNIWLDATVEHTAKGFLGLTLACARCHDHKYDPLTQSDYYAFRAIFEPHKVRTDRLPGQADLKLDGLPRAYDADLDAATYLYIRGDEKQPDKEHPLLSGVPTLFGLPFDVEPVNLPALASFPSLAEFIEHEELAAAEQALQKSLASLEKAQASTDQQPALTPRAGPPNSSRPPAPALPVTIAAPLELGQRVLRAAELELQALRDRWRADRARFDPQVRAKLSAEQLQALALRAAESERASKVAAAEQVLFAALLKYRSTFTEPHKTPSARSTAIQKALEAVNQADKALTTARKDLNQTDGKYTPVGPTYPQTSTGRRLALARWIVHPQHPLTARVAVNQIWMRHFGRPLVDDVFDFGLRSPRPVLGDVLDWLAAELVESGWNLKHIHRLIVTSQAYQRASSGESALLAANAAIDPDNRYLWRAEVRRLEAEVVRDSLLATAGKLDRTFGGPDLDYGDGESIPRRSLYFRHAYEKQMTMLVLFDAASPNECYRRESSIVPQQALALSNSSLSRAMAHACQRAISASTPSDDEKEFVTTAFHVVLGRAPDPRELDTCLTFLSQQGQQLAVPGQSAQQKSTKTDTPPVTPQARARENLVHVLFNHNDFVTLR